MRGSRPPPHPHSAPLGGASISLGAAMAGMGISSALLAAGLGRTQHPDKPEPPAPVAWAQALDPKVPVTWTAPSGSPFHLCLGWAQANAAPLFLLLLLQPHCVTLPLPCRICPEPLCLGCCTGSSELDPASPWVHDEPAPGTQLTLCCLPQRHPHGTLCPRWAPRWEGH